MAIDVKTIRGSKSKEYSAIHLVSAWACDNNLCLGQVRTSEKSNQIAAILRLLEILSLENTVVTIDAMVCQREIVKSVIKNKADYILALKGNQAELEEEVVSEFEFQKTVARDESIDVDHGRIETRTCKVITDLEFINGKKHWKGLKSLIQITSKREFKNSTKSPQTAVRYYISSLEASPDQFQRAIRNHWSIENKLHWALDVTFNKDNSRKRSGNSAHNISIISKIVLNILRNDKSVKIGVKGKKA